MPVFRHVFRGDEPEDFPAPPIARRLQPGDVIEYEADEPIVHPRLELTDQALDGWERLEHHAQGMGTVLRPPAAEQRVAGGAGDASGPPRARRGASSITAAEPTASATPE